MGHWGMPRAQQVLFVLVVYSAQIVFSYWWLSVFHYGPMEWLWRGFTYGHVPQFRGDSRAARLRNAYTSGSASPSGNLRR